MKGLYGVSVSIKARVSCLHLVGGCWRQPGVDYLMYEDLGSIADASKYNRMCKQFWSSGLGAPRLRRKKRRGTSPKRRVLCLLRLSSGEIQPS